MSLKKIIDTSVVKSLLKQGVINKEGVRLLDCSFPIGTRPDWKEYEKNSYGQFGKLLSEPTAGRQLYLSGHVPEAVYFDFNVAMYPSKYERFSHYPPELFEKFVKMIGLNSGEHLVFYGRGPVGGMLYASKAAWLFKTYGHEKVSLVDGGFDAWKKQKFEISTDDLRLPKGNWKAEDKFKEHLVTFEQLVEKTGDEKPFIEKTSEVNFLDTRIRGQFNGSEETGLDSYRVNGCRIPGFKNTPAVELVNKEGRLKSADEVLSWLKLNGMESGKPVVTNCNIGVQAALVAYVADAADPAIRPRLYNGSLKEMEQRDPKKISEGPQHLPVK